jgi:hypothetical protein
MLLPGVDVDIIKEYDLTPSRRLEQVLIEQIATSVYMLILVGLMGLALIAALRWRWAEGMASAPLLLLPGWRAMLRILVLAVLLPLVAYYAYTRWSGLAGREFGFGYLGYRFALEMLLLGVTIVGLAVTMAGRRIRRRCESLGVAVPAPMPAKFRLAFWALTAALWASCLTFREDSPSVPWWLVVLALASLPSVLAMGRLGIVRVVVFWAVLVAALGAICLVYREHGLDRPFWAIALAVVVLAGTFAVGVVVAGRLLFGRAEYGLYRGTVARSLIPIFAAASLVIAAATHPYLVTREAALVGADKALSPDSSQISFTRAESLMVERLKAGVLQAVREIEAKP